MFGFLGFILFFILVIVLLVFALLGNLVRAIFGLGRRAPKHYYGETNTSSQEEQSYSSNQSHQASSTISKKKIFTEDEGEYVEYEEVK
ncbi:MAG: DUF4834 family protein [Bacteroides sp.]|nr:DUF4834 family protein [Bacteroides sp.]MBQ8265739.1 DUF4834 family protein [Bacteroides sp.]MBQ8875532.1 DUF4834 family protein [Bacteroides sp.]